MILTRDQIYSSYEHDAPDGTIHSGASAYPEPTFSSCPEGRRATTEEAGSPPKPQRRQSCCKHSSNHRKPARSSLSPSDNTSPNKAEVQPTKATTTGVPNTPSTVPCLPASTHQALETAMVEWTVITQQPPIGQPSTTKPRRSSGPPSIAGNTTTQPPELDTKVRSPPDGESS